MRSVREFQTYDEYLVAMIEDLFEWMRSMYGCEAIGSNANTFLDRISNGVLLCVHANMILKASGQVDYVSIPYRAKASPDTFSARDNVSNFIEFARSQVRVRECLMFETDDLILRKNVRNVVLCLLEVARYGASFGLHIPSLLELEKDIAAQIRNVGLGEEEKQSFRDDELHEQVKAITDRLQFEGLERVSEGKYVLNRAGAHKSPTTLYIRLLRGHVMMMNSGTDEWNTLQNYLENVKKSTSATAIRSTSSSSSTTTTSSSMSATAEEEAETRATITDTSSSSTIIEETELVDDESPPSSSPAITQLTAQMVTGIPVPKRLILKYRGGSRTLPTTAAAAAAVSDTTINTVTNKQPRPFLTPSPPAHNKNHMIRMYTGSSKTLAASSFRANRAYEWRKKALKFRNFLEESRKKTTTRDVNFQSAQNFNYHELKGSEFIYDERQQQRSKDNHQVAVDEQRPNNNNHIKTMTTDTTDYSITTSFL